jgi:hypothetical protein
MRTAFISFILTLWVLCSYSQTGPGAMLPEDTDIPGWRPAGELKIYSPEILRQIEGDKTPLIMEYGFRWAVVRDYYSLSGKLINVKVYTMDNTFGSYGLFLQTSKGKKVFQDFGNSTIAEPGKFCFWKHYYLIKMESASQGDTITEGFRKIAGFIDSKIRTKGLFPQIMGLSKEKTGKLIIFRGPLALSDIYYFSSLDVFGIREGIAIENSDNLEIIFKYEDNNEAVRRFSDAAGILGSMTKFKEFIMVGDFSFAMHDLKGKTLVFKVIDDCLNITIK